MGLFDLFTKSKPARTHELRPEGKCTQLVVLEVTCRPGSGGAEAWFFTLSEEGQKRLMIEEAMRGLAAVRERYPSQVSIDLEGWTRHCILFNGTAENGQREA